MQIRTMTMEDYESVYQLWRSTPGMGLNTSDDSREGIAQYLSRNPNTCFVAEGAGEIIGTILGGHDGRRGFIYHLATKTNRRGQGIGGQLVDAVMEALKQEGINKVALVVFCDNELGNTFWEKNGFTAREELTYRTKSINELEYIRV
ncbi:MAG: GNAT family N-acetyltransferase [Oscillospiraceae bacterium]|nr:GNAT family N-acetyltransferase [Oscillospiraceae bacterium]